MVLMDSLDVSWEKMPGSFKFVAVSVFASAYVWSATESTLKSQAEVKGVPLNVTHQQQRQQEHAEDSKRPQVELSMC